LSNVLLGQATMEELATSTDIPNLDVATCGPTPPNPVELLAGPYARDMVAQAADWYDQVIFDGPPVLLVNDALWLAGWVDGVILVCRARITPRAVAQRARERLASANGRVLGAVLNAAQTRRGGYFREHIRTYYDYLPAGAFGMAPRRSPTPGQSHQV